ncbi:MAG: sugar ABC transporter permease [Treponema sp.]|jgi:ABC-type sugar transport system permease subunit|nr:sugar ABC transporter permease [Treponema sp.]
MKKTGMKTLNNETFEAWILISPIFLLMLVFIAVPVLSNFYYCFTNWNGISKPQFIGLQNFARMVNDNRFLSSLKNLGILILYIPLGVALPLIIAAVLRKGIKGWEFFRSVFYLPNVLGPVLLGILFSVMFSQVGPITEILKLLGIPDAEKIYLFGKSASAINTMAFLFVVWTRLGFGVIYFLSAMSTIDVSLYEAADLDGVNALQRFIHITIPSVIFSIQFFFVLAFIEVFARMYGWIYVLTRGGPGFATYTLEYGIYNLNFTAFQRGYASSWAAALFLCCAVIALIQIRLIKRGT